MNNYVGESFIDKIYKDMHLAEMVNHISTKSDNKYEKLRKYFERLENISKKSMEHKKIELLKIFYYKKYIIKEENISESYFEKQKKIALDRGYGHIEYTSETKKQEINNIINEQKSSLDSWLDYFMSEETNIYPTWYKYFVFQGMLKLGYFDKERNSFTKRTDSTVKPFIELNAEALALIYSELIKILNKEDIDDQKLSELINNGSFSKLYTYAIKKVDFVKDDGFKSDEGIWKKYIQGSDPQILFNDIHGKGTGWCTAGGIETATTQLNGGDFHVYYTKDKEGNFTNPRIAIRMENNKLFEIRGVAQNQNLEPNMEKVVEEKLKEIPDKEEYNKKVKDMEMLTYIYTKWQNNGELTKEELRFLYEIDEKIIGFGYFKDPRINEILHVRDKRKDLAYCFDCAEENISFTKEEALKGNIVFHYGNLDLNDLNSAEGLVLPQHIKGYLALSGLKTSKGLVLPKKMNGSLYLDGLKDIDGLLFPEVINGSLDLSGIEIINGAILSKKVNGCLYLNSLKFAEDLVLPEEIKNTLKLTNLSMAKNVIFPTILNAGLDLNKLIIADGVVLSRIINGDLWLELLSNVEGIVLPEEINGDLWMNKIHDCNEMVFSKNVRGNIYL